MFGFGESAAKDSVEAAPYKVEAPTFIALGEPPATVIVPIEGAGAVEVKAEAPKAKKPRAKKPAGDKKPRAKKAPKA